MDSDIEVARRAVAAFERFGEVVGIVLSPIFADIQAGAKQFREVLQHALYHDAVFLERVWGDRDLRALLYRGGFDVPWEVVQ